MRAAAGRLEVEVGARRHGREELEARAEQGRPLHARVLGRPVIAPDVPGALAAWAIGSLTGLRTLQASAEVRRALEGRIS